MRLPEVLNVIKMQLEAFKEENPDLGADESRWTLGIMNKVEGMMWGQMKLQNLQVPFLELAEYKNSSYSLQLSKLF